MLQLFIQNIEVKLYSNKEEQIVVNRKLKDYRDIEKIFGDYSESFTVPASANNEIFKHYYDADVVDGFDARIKQPAYILFDGELWKRGTIQLKHVEIKNNKAVNYQIQFFGEVTQLVDLFGEDELTDLDYSDFDHDYTLDNVEKGMKDTLFPGKVIYPLISYDRRFLYDTDQTNIDDFNATDIEAVGSNVDQGVVYTELYPAIKINEIFDLIQDKYNITFTGSVFSNSAFTEIYMNLYNKGQELPRPTTVIANQNYTVPSTFIVTSNTSIEVQPASQDDQVFYKVILEINNSVKYDSGFIFQGTQTIEVNNLGLENLDNYDYKVTVVSLTPITFTWDYEINYLNAVLTPTTETDSGSDSTQQAVMELVNYVQEFQIVDFIKAFVKAFNLVVIPENETTILFEPLQNWYADGKIVDITNYVGTEQLRVSPGKLIKGVDLKYEKAETFLSAVFKENNDRTFGEINVEFQDNNNNDLVGEILNVELPFEKPVFENITNFSNSNTTDATYGYYVNREQEQFNPFHTLFYVRTFAAPIRLKLEKELGTESTVFFAKVPVTCQNPGTTVALNFDNEIDESTFQENNVNLFSEYYGDYVNDLFSPKRRQYNLKAKLPKYITSNIALNDRLLIGQRRYIINSYQHNLNTDVIKFELLNDIFNGSEAVGQEIALNTEALTVNVEGVSVTVGSTGGFNIDTTSTPASWYSVTINEKQLTINVDENTTSSDRIDTLDVTFDDVAKTKVELYIFQYG